MKVFEIPAKKEEELLQWDIRMEQGKLTVTARSPIIAAFFAHASKGRKVLGDFGERYVLEAHLELPLPVFFGNCGGTMMTNEGNYNLSWLLNPELKDGLTISYTDIVPWSAVQSLNRALIAVVKAMQFTYLRSTTTGGRISVRLDEELEPESEEDLG